MKRIRYVSEFVTPMSPEQIDELAREAAKRLSETLERVMWRELIDAEVDGLQS